MNRRRAGRSNRHCGREMEGRFFHSPRVGRHQQPEWTGFFFFFYIISMYLLCSMEIILGRLFFFFWWGFIFSLWGGGMGDIFNFYLLLVFLFISPSVFVLLRLNNYLK